MNQQRRLVGLNIDTNLVEQGAKNFLPSSWPPNSDFPVVIDASGNVVSRYGDSSWDLSPWAKERMGLNFGDGPRRKNCPEITAENADIFRRVVAWWLYGSNSVRSPNTLVGRFTILRPLFVLCSRGPKPILATQLSQFPRVAERLVEVLHRSQSGYVLTLLHELWERREDLGFVILDSAGLKRLAAVLPARQSAQTPYIPPRIWLYQVGRLRSLLDDFLEHREQIADCYRFCLSAYAWSASSNESLHSEQSLLGRSSLSLSVDHRYEAIRTGPSRWFAEIAARFGIKELLERWLLKPGEILEDSIIGIQSLSKFFTLIGYAGIGYLLNFSMMRIEEAWSLRIDCLTIERDELGDDIYILQGPTTKTVKDDDARWIASPSVKVAVDAMTIVSKLRMLAADANPNVPSTPEYIQNPHLFERAYEPWVSNPGDISRPLSTRPQFGTYRDRLSRWLFDPEELRITAADIEAARLITPSLDPARFDAGLPWQFGWHQLRRTGAVNMNASGVVGDASVQYQLKHVSRAMSRYYGQGYYHLQLRTNGSARLEYIRTMYEVIAREFSLLGSDRFVSPHGERHKERITNLVSAKDHTKLVAAAKAGKIAYREHLLGGCTNPNPCPFGGIDSIAPCGGDNNPCEHLLYDKKKVPIYRKLQKAIAARVVQAPEASPLLDSLRRQEKTVERAIHACEVD